MEQELTDSERGGRAMKRAFAGGFYPLPNSTNFYGFLALHAAGVCLSGLGAQVCMQFIAITAPVVSHMLVYSLMGLPLVILLQIPIAWVLYAKGKPDWSMGLGFLSLLYPAIGFLLFLWMV
jgi:hypothetical protein